MEDSDLRAVWDHDAIPYEEFLHSAEKNESLWRGVYKTAQIPEWAHQLASNSSKLCMGAPSSGESRSSPTADWLRGW